MARRVAAHGPAVAVLASGPQQVNTTIIPDGETKLSAGERSPPLETVGEIDRAENTGRESSRQDERTQARPDYGSGQSGAKSDKAAD